MGVGVCWLWFLLGSFVLWLRVRTVSHHKVGGCSGNLFVRRLSQVRGWWLRFVGGSWFGVRLCFRAPPLARHST